MDLKSILSEKRCNAEALCSLSWTGIGRGLWAADWPRKNGNSKAESKTSLLPQKINYKVIQREKELKHPITAHDDKSLAKRPGETQWLPSQTT